MEATEQLEERIDERVIAMLSPDAAPGFVRACNDEFAEYGLDLRIDSVSRNSAEVVILAPAEVLERHHHAVSKFWNGYAAGMLAGLTRAGAIVASECSSTGGRSAQPG